MVRTCASRCNFSLAKCGCELPSQPRTSARANCAARSSQPSPLLTHDRDLGIRPEFLVIAISLFDILVVALEQRHARVEMKLNKFGQPHFIIHSGQLDENMRAFVDPRKHEADRHCVDGCYVELDPLCLRLVNPDAAFE